MSRLLLVSNRLPVTSRRMGGEVVLASGGAGGLVAGLGPVHEEGNGLWFGTMKDGHRPEIRQQLESRRLVSVPVPAADARRHYRGYSNGAIWPLFHYLQEQAQFATADFESYRRVNALFADTIAARARPGDQIWINDYHFLLLPQMLRERIPAAKIGFFLHIPFPSSEVFRLLPHREEVLRGLLGANLIGLHTYDYSRHLVSSFRRVLAVEFDQHWVAENGYSCRIGVFPMGIDVLGFHRRLKSPQVPQYVERFRRRLKGRRIILGVDRLDYTKGLLLKLEAYRRLLERWPQWKTEAVLVQIANPTREEIAPYRRLKEQVEQSVGQINGIYETEGRVPIHYLYRSFSPEALAAYYQMADVAMVTPVRDGMNLVAKEYVACQTSDSGVLILSEFAGAASEMGEAIRVNPWNIDACAHALNTALNMDPQERARRMQLLRHRIEASDVRKWVARFRHALEMTEPALGGVEAASDSVGQWREACGTAFGRAERCLLMLDYDGTLVDLATRPERAAPPDEIRQLLTRLAQLCGVEVAVVSGRDRGTLKEWLDGLPISLVGEHGYALRRRGQVHWDHLIDNADFSWMDSVHEVLADYAARTSGAWVENKPSSLAWHYREVEPGFGNWQARELANHISEAFQQSPIEVLHGSKVVEVRHQGIGKGAAVAALLQQFGPCDHILVAGDDRTDEEMFQAAPPQAWTVKIGHGRSRARYRLESTSSLRRLLIHLADLKKDAVSTSLTGPAGSAS